jgi:ABC-type lipoprotein export system ATPase subunit
MRRFVADMNPTLRGFLIIGLIARTVVVLNLYTALASLYVLARIAFLLAIAFFVYLVWRERREHVLTALSVVGLEDRVKHYPRQLSGGQEQRVAIARAIVSDPTILVADEPTGDLDAKSAEEILTLLKRLNEEFRKTIVLVTHDAKAASRAHRMVHLDKGVLHAEELTEAGALRPV